MEFKLYPEQIKKLKAWKEKHKCDSNAGTIGGLLSYTFVPTGLGKMVLIKCLCGESLDLTDIKKW